jgi:hypothetical protein
MPRRCRSASADEDDTSDKNDSQTTDMIDQTDIETACDEGYETEREESDPNNTDDDVSSCTDNEDGEYEPTTRDGLDRIMSRWQR